MARTSRSALGPYDFTSGTAVVTGAASGMGEQMAHQLAGAGSRVMLIDRDQERLQGVVADIERAHPGARVRTLVADLADVESVPGLAESILSMTPDVTLLINNAGVAMGGFFDQLSAEEFDWVMAVNFRAPVALTRALLPTLVAHPGSHLVNVSSLFGLIGPPAQSAYASSKFALRGFTEVLRHELVTDGVGVTCVHPGGIATRIAQTARVAAAAPPQQVEEGRRNFDKLLTYPADKAAAKILDGVERRRRRVLIGASAVVPDVMARAFPSHYQEVLARLSPGTARNSAPPKERVDPAPGQRQEVGA